MNYVNFIYLFILFIYLLFILLCACLSVFQFTEVTTQNDFHIGLSIRAKDRKVEVSWRNVNVSNEDSILLFDEDPSKMFGGNNLTYLRKITPQKESGWETTDVSYSSSKKYNISTAGSQCHAFWIAYINANNTILKVNCFRTYPTWMSDTKDKIGNYRFSELFIPGTHDSAAYSIKTNFFFDKYIITQDEDIKEQLIYGIRYLDIRVGYYGKQLPFTILESLKNEREEVDVFWANHDIVQLQPLKYIFEQIVDFVEHTNEIVIVDIQEFPVGFKDKDGNDIVRVHQKLLKFIKKYLGNHITRTNLTWGATLNDIWKEGRRIIVGYDQKEIAQGLGSEVVFQAVKHQWGKATTLEELYNHLKSLTEGAYPSLEQYRPVAAMAELTPRSYLDIISDKFGGLRNMADLVNQNVTNCYFDDWGNKANIVALDFFRGTDIVQAALYWNEIRCRT